MHTNHLYDRRTFIRQVLAGSGLMLLSAGEACRPRDPLAHIKGSILGANHKTGHLLRNTGNLPAPVRSVTTGTLIIGGGVSGLSARRWLHKNGHDDVLLLEMDDHFGGNAHSGKNEVSAYPWGAHYLPIPDMRNTELLDFLQETGTITGYRDGLPVYNEYHLCHDPEERLYINGIWQEGLVPDVGVPAREKEQMARFARAVNDFKNAVGTDGRDAFCIPLDRSSGDEQFHCLDKISFARYLADEGYTSPHLLWYLEYGCKDDYGSNLHNTSAWAGIHYFAARKGKGAGLGPSAVLTWPQGNGFLAAELRSQCPVSNIFTSQLVYGLTQEDGKVRALVYDVARKESYTVVANHAIVATPQFVNRHLLASVLPTGRQQAYGAFSYAPWVIANITVREIPTHKGMPLCWDNVFYNTTSVGYVNANHQDLGPGNRRVITYYLPLAFEDPDTARMRIRDKDYRYWLGQVIAELEQVHPGITAEIEATDIWVWGHGMIAPRPGFIWGIDKAAAREPIGNIFFAHSDLSGISIFEEAFYQGINAAQQVMRQS